MRKINDMEFLQREDIIQYCFRPSGLCDAIAEQVENGFLSDVPYKKYEADIFHNDSIVSCEILFISKQVAESYLIHKNLGAAIDDLCGVITNLKTENQLDSVKNKFTQNYESNLSKFDGENIIDSPCVLLYYIETNTPKKKLLDVYTTSEARKIVKMLQDEAK